MNSLQLYGISPAGDKQILLDQISRFPECPGVYIMKDVSDTPIYIGKAVNLRSRVRSYFFDSHDDRIQIPSMLQKLDHIEWIATRNEIEALILEANLIRSKKPHYNVELRDDKHFPYLKVTLQERFPRLLVVRRVEKDGARYFGPYTDVRAMRSLMGFAKKIFKLRDCNKNLPLSRPQRPCINYSMKRCSGACAGYISEEEYRQGINDLIRFLSGRRKDLLKELQERMERASVDLRFETAAMIRDQIQLINNASKLQQVDLLVVDSDCDVFGIAEGDRSISLAILNFREGLLTASRNFLFRRTTWDFSTSNHDNIFFQYYSQKDEEPPSEIYISSSAGFNSDILQTWLNQQYESKSSVITPQKGTKRLFIEIAEKNAKLYMVQNVPSHALDDIADLQKVLQLPRLPETIEAFDISNLGESFTVAGMVRFKHGLPDKGGYRRFKIKTVDGQNDFAMMMEVVTRRLRRLRDENKPFADLLLIDGGPGQLNAARDALSLFENPPMIASLAKREEILYSPCSPTPVALPPTHPARRLVERIRDEVHRYAITYHRKIRGKQFSTSVLETIEGIGKKRAQILLKQFGSVKRIKETAAEDIAKSIGLPLEKAVMVLNILRKE
jgi:excinuclease ABC subunit C